VSVRGLQDNASGWSGGHCPAHHLGTLCPLIQVSALILHFYMDSLTPATLHRQSMQMVIGFAVTISMELIWDEFMNGS
jgi:hypothetical protein